jgi:hypothetical protein
MKKEYRIWNHESSQGHYVIADSPKKVVIEFTRNSIGFIMDLPIFHYPLHTMLWKKGKDLYSLKMTEGAKKFMHYRGDDKYTKYGRKYYKKDLK